MLHNKFLGDSQPFNQEFIYHIGSFLFVKRSLQDHLAKFFKCPLCNTQLIESRFFSDSIDEMTLFFLKMKKIVRSRSVNMVFSPRSIAALQTIFSKCLLIIIVDTYLTRDPCLFLCNKYLISFYLILYSLLHSTYIKERSKEKTGKHMQ